MLEIFAVGGYEEVGRNSTAVRYGDEIVIFDLGFHMERVVSMQEDGDGHSNINDQPLEKLRAMDALPDDRILDPYKGQVKAIVSNHGHLDHIGGIPKLAGRYNCPIISTPYTTELIDSLMREAKVNNTNQLMTMHAGEEVELSKNLTLEFVHTTHSIPHTVFSVLHTPEGAVIYANDYKLDNYPQLGEKPDYSRMREIGKAGVKALIVETVRIERERKTPSEQVARAMLEDVLLGRQHDRGLFITTFASHIERIKSIVEIAGEMDKQVVLMGRSMNRYSTIAEKLGIIKYPNYVSMAGRGKAIANDMAKIKKNKSDYLMLCTGHQGEPGSVLTRLADKMFPYTVDPGDEIIFSSQVIPSPINQDNHYRLTTKLKHQGARLFEQVHVSGHASKEDHRDLLEIFRPEHIVPCHGDIVKRAEYAKLADEMNVLNEFTNRNYDLGKTIHLLNNGKKHTI